jgi:multidrug efflux pump subunit AcrB
MSGVNDSSPFLTRIVEMFLRGDVAGLLIVLSLVLGGVALVLTPREEEPQIVVPLADVIVRAPGLSAEEVERQVTIRLEKLLYQIDGVEYVYSMSRPGESVVTVRFYVGEDREDSLLKLYNKIHSHTDQVPPVVSDWVVKPVEIDDVPIVTVTLYSEQPERYGDHELRRIAEQIQNDLQAIPNTNRVQVLGGRPRVIRVELDPGRLAARRTSALQVAEALQAANVNLRAGRFDQANREFAVEAGTFVRDARDLRELVIRVADQRPVYLKDVATVIDGPAEVETYSWFGYGPADALDRAGVKDLADERGRSDRSELLPAVHIAVAKRKGTNAVWVADSVHRRMEEIAAEVLPDGVRYRITRDYGETANDKVNELVEGLAIAVITVIGLIGLVLGWRSALVIALAIPVCYSVTLFVNLFAGYTINRVTMFALILSLGLLVDDPITDVENIARYFTMKLFPPRQSVLRAVQEVRPALILSTLAIIVSFLPLVFITGMMGPYMAPMALNVPLTVSISTLVAFLITPWLAMVALRKPAENGKDTPPGDTSQAPAATGETAFDLAKTPLYQMSRAVLLPVLQHRWLSWVTLVGVAMLLAAAMVLPALRLVPLKMLPYDNKNEFQIVIDMPEGTTLEATDATARDLGKYLTTVSEVRDIQIFTGLASPMDFNGMVRHYFLRRGSHLADIRVSLAPKEYRAQQSHDILLRIRDDLTDVAQKHGANVKLVEVPPGPPVLATITAEIYGPEGAAYESLVGEARRVAARLRVEPGIVDVDTSGEERRTRRTFVTDKAKAELSGVTTEDIARTMELALSGHRPTVLHLPREVDPLHIELRLPRPLRSSADDLAAMYVRGRDGQMVQLSELGRFVEQREDQTIYHKNLRRVAFVFAEVAGRPPAEAIIDVQLDRCAETTAAEGRRLDDAIASLAPRPAGEARNRTWLTPGGGASWSVAPGYIIQWAGEGEWKITLDVFRDLGLAFAAAQVGIFVILMFQTQSRLLPLVIMLAIPLTLIGIMPGFWLLNVIMDHPVGGHPTPVFFTATAMIGMIALSGIVVRNSVVLIDFVHYALAEGIELREALIRSVAIRTRPILLTAGTTLLGNWVIALDPIFSGLAWSIMFGIFASTLFTLLVIPVVYWLLYGKRPPITSMTEAQA